MSRILAYYTAKAGNFLLPSLTISSIFYTIKNFIVDNTPSEIFGFSLSIWGVAFVINLIDIHTGIKANKVEREKDGQKFEFNSTRGWRAIEKIVGFTVAIWAIYNFQKEAMRLNYVSEVIQTLEIVKAWIFFYVILIEFQSIGENQKTRYGDKGKVFKLLDTIIDTVNNGIIENIKRLLRMDTNQNNINNEQE